MGWSSLVLSLIMIVVSFKRFTFLGWQISRGSLSSQANINRCRILAWSSSWRSNITHIVLLLLKRGLFRGLQSLQLFQLLFGQTLLRRVLVVWNWRCFVAKEIGPIFAVRSIFADAEIWGGVILRLNNLNNVERVMNKPISAAHINLSTVDSLSWNVRRSSATVRWPELNRL